MLGSFTTPLRTESAPISLTNTSFYFVLQTGSDVTTKETLWLVPESGDADHEIYIQSGRVYIVAGSGKNQDDSGIWYTTGIAIDSTYAIAITHQFGGSTSVNPVIYINGSSQTVTESQTPDDSTSIDAETHYIGATDAGASPCTFNEIGDFAIWDSRLSATELVTLTEAGLRMMPLSITTLPSYYWAMDEFGAGQDAVEGATLTPNTDIAIPWDGSTNVNHWENINSDDNDRAWAGKLDDNETEKQGFTSTTLSGNEEVVGTLTTIKLNSDDGDNATVQLRASGVDKFNVLVSPGSSKTTFEIEELSDWTQAEVDSVEVWVTTPTMGKDAGIDYYFAEVKISTRERPIRAEIGDINLLGLSGVCTGAESRLGYP